MLRAKVQDASAKVKLLDREVVFNDTIVATLRELRDVKKMTDATGVAIKQGQLLEASRLLRRSEIQSRLIGSRVGAGLTRVVQERIERMRSRIIDMVGESWSKSIIVEPAAYRLTIHTQIEGQ